ncbi:MAG: methyltransferase domain-containing protein [Desulfobacteraceae bacterium]|nr:MAG: methyltransferase domain-containing protein [Desulfobacteraceae bacterium]
MSLYEPPYKDLCIYYLKGRIGRDLLLEKEKDFIGNWEEADDSFLFFKRPADRCMNGLLGRQPHLVLHDRYQMSYEQWQGDTVSPFRVGCLQVTPPWHAEAHRLDKTGILLDPGVVFGTGSHPTTRDCLTALQRAFEFRSPASVLDLGTGTGLLALAAVRLGARKVLAVDLNHLAAQTARRNAVLNRMTDRLCVVQGNAINFMDISSDLMISNVHYEVMRHLIAAPGFARQKQFILSGLLRTQAREIEYQLHKQTVEIVHKWEQDGTWHTYYGHNNA